MAKKKTAKAIAASIERSKVRATTTIAEPREKLMLRFAEAAYKLGQIQDELGRLNALHEQAQKEVQALKLQIDKRGKG